MFLLLFDNSQNYDEHNFLLKLKNFSKSFIINTALVLLAILICFFINKILNFFGYHQYFEIANDYKKSISIDYEYAIPIVIIAPIFEELIFRLPLKVSKLNLNISLFVLFATISITTLSLSDGNFLYLVYSAIIGFLLILFLNIFYNTIEKVISQNRKKYLTLSILFFGLFHISNFENLHFELCWLYPFFVLPQLIGGYFITNLRIKYGFLWAVAFHILYNLSAYSIGMLIDNF